MKRRSFIKGMIGSALFATFSGLVRGESHPKPSIENGTIYAETGIIQHEGTLYIADRDTVRWCPVNKLYYDSWRKASTGFGKEDYDTFDHWKEFEGRLFWCGKATMWEVLRHPVMGGEFRFSGWYYKE